MRLLPSGARGLAVSDSSDKIQSQAASNAFTGERAFKQVFYPDSGDRELNFLTAVLVAGREENLTPAALERLCHYLVERYRHSAVEEAIKSDALEEFRIRQEKLKNMAKPQLSGSAMEQIQADYGQQPGKGKTLMEAFGLIKP